MDKQTEIRIAYFPTTEEINCVSEYIQNALLEERSLEKALFFLYRMVMLLKKRLSQAAGNRIQEEENLLHHLQLMSFVYELLDYEEKALEVQKYAQKYAEQEPVAAEEIRFKIERGKGNIQNLLFFEGKKITKEQVLCSYQNIQLCWQSYMKGQENLRKLRIIIKRPLIFARFIYFEQRKKKEKME